jgi:beta-N-acetylhexosaminidase
MTAPRAVVFGLSGPLLSADEKAFLREADPLGAILFARNCVSHAQVRALTDDIRAALGRTDAPIFIDQEGGRVMRLRPPAWADAPPARRLGEIYENGGQSRAIAAAETLGRLFAAELRDLGIDVDCAPVLDLGLPETTAAIGDRAYAGNPGTVATLGRAMARGLLAGGCLPVIKHMPGHGRATVDSHEELPRVAAGLEVLREHDYVPFSALRDLPIGMTAHVIYESLDPDMPGTLSRRVVDGAIRGDIEFDGFLISDDITMHALDGTQGARAAAAIAAGCDAVLHCSGKLAEMVDVASAVPALDGVSAERWTRAGAMRAEPAATDVAALAAELAARLENEGARA